MRFMSRILITALIALAWTVSASAETPGSNPSVEPGDFESLTELRLQSEFEKSVAGASHSQLHGLAGPTTMNCSHAVTRTELETCVVTAEGTPNGAVPAALAVN